MFLYSGSLTPSRCVHGARTSVIRLTEADETCHTGAEITLGARIYNGR